MTSITSPNRHALAPTAPDEPRWTSLREGARQDLHAQRRQRQESAPIPQNPAAVRRDLLAASEAAANSGGLGNSAEEIFLNAGERFEVETHDAARDAREAQADRVDALMRIDAIHQLMRQLAGEQRFASLRQRAEAFATMWVRGQCSQALEKLESGDLDPTERQALMHMALLKLPKGPEAEQLGDHLRHLEAGGGLGPELVRKLMDRTTAEGSSGESAARPGASPLSSLLQSPPTLRLVQETSASLGPDGLARIAQAALPRGRTDQRVTNGAQVFLSLTLLRMVQQVRQVEQTSAVLMKTGGCAGAGNPDEVRKTARWLLDTTFAPSPQSSLGRMGTVMKINGDALAAVRRRLQRELPALPEGVWLNGDTKQLVNVELRNANAADLQRKGMLSPTGKLLPGPARGV